MHISRRSSASPSAKQRFALHLAAATSAAAAAAAGVNSI
jgi:hypothetical protein